MFLFLIPTVKHLRGRSWAVDKKRTVLQLFWETNQCTGPRAGADKVMMAQTKVIVVIFQHVWHIDPQLILLWVYIIWQPSSWKRYARVRFSFDPGAFFQAFLSVFTLFPSDIW